MLVIALQGAGQDSSHWSAATLSLTIRGAVPQAAWLMSL